MVTKMTAWLCLAPFLKTGEPLHLADISRKLKKNHTSVRKHLNLIEKQGVLIKQIKGRLTLYSLNASNPLIIDYLVLAEKENLIKKCRESLLLNEVVSFLHQNLNENNKALIFGSSAEDIKKANDIDIIITEKINFEGKIKDFEKRFNIEIHLINVKSLSAVSESLKKEVFEKHLIIQGSEEVIKWLI